MAEIEHAACALDIGFYVCRKILKGKREEEEDEEEEEEEGEGTVSKNRATVAHMPDTE